MENLETTDNPYVTPKAELEMPVDIAASFYVVSIRKFTVLFFSTLGLYGLYWFYANWKNYRLASGERIWPVPRALFNIFFAHSLFAKVQAVLKQRGETFSWSPSASATAYVVAAVLSNVLDRLSMQGLWSPNSDILSLLLLPVLYYTLLKPQRAINLSAGDAEGATNSSFTPANYVWLGLGIMLWLLMLIGLLGLFGVIGA